MKASLCGMNPKSLRFLNVCFREFLMTDARDGTSRTVRQFHFVSWPEGAEVPSHADNFIDLIGQVRNFEAIASFYTFRCTKRASSLELLVQFVSTALPASGEQAFLSA